MTLQEAFAVIASSSGLQATEVESLITAATSNVRFIRVAHLSQMGYSGQMRLNLLGGKITDIQIVTSDTAIEKLLSRVDIKP